MTNPNKADDTKNILEELCHLSELAKKLDSLVKHFEEKAAEHWDLADYFFMPSESFLDEAATHQEAAEDGDEFCDDHLYIATRYKELASLYGSVEFSHREISGEWHASAGILREIAQTIHWIIDIFPAAESCPSEQP